MAEQQRPSWFWRTFGIIGLSTVTIAPFSTRAQAFEQVPPRPDAETLRVAIENDVINNKPPHLQASVLERALRGEGGIHDPVLEAQWQQQLAADKQAEKGNELLEKLQTEAALKKRALELGGGVKATLLKAGSKFSSIKTSADVAMNLMSVLTGINEKGEPVGFWDSFNSLEKNINDWIQKVFEAGSIGEKIMTKGKGKAELEQGWYKSAGLIDEGLKEKMANEMSKGSAMDPEKMKRMAALRQKVQLYGQRKIIEPNPRVQEKVAKNLVRMQEALGRT